MKRFVCGIGVLALALGIAADSASAQLAGNPVYAVNPAVGVTLNGDFGLGVNEESGKNKYAGGRIALGIPMISFWAGAGLMMDTLDATDHELTFGGGAAINLIKAPVLPVALSFQAGGGYVSCETAAITDCSKLTLIAGPALRINLPSPAVRVEPWVMPRVHMTRKSQGGESVMQTGFGASGGLNINLPMGLGFHVVADLATLPRKVSGALTAAKQSPLTVGVGIHYTIAVPSLGLPLVPIN